MENRLENSLRDKVSGVVLPLLLLGAALLQTGCSSTRSMTDVRSPASVLDRSTDDVAANPDGLEASLRMEIDDWLGVPHVYGGTTLNGVDCSGFVFRIYSDLLGVELPRTTDRQKEAGRSVLLSSLRAGDLIFFKPDPKTRHVGIMLNEHEFVHASSSRGVMISGIDESYWRTRYWLARRILTESAMSAAGIDSRNQIEPARMSW